MAVGVLDRRLDLGHVGIDADEVLGDAHVVEDRLNDANAVARRFARRLVWIMLQQSDHHADRLLVFDCDAADRIDGIEKASVLDQHQRALVAVEQAGSDAHAFVLLADADQSEGRILCDRRKQSRAGSNVRHREDVFDAARLESGDDGAPAESAFAIGCRPARFHSLSPRPNALFAAAPAA